MADIRIVIADDELLFRKGLTRLLSELGGIQIVGEASNGKELLQRLQSWQGEPPQVLLLDISMPEMDGITAFPQIHKQFPDLKIIILTVFSDDRHIITMIEAGAHGYLVKNSEPDEVKRAIVTVIEHDYYFNDRTLRAMQKSMQRRKNRSALPVDTDLTARETEVLELICNEYTAVEIAKRLFISERTVEGHRNHLLLKTGAKNTAGLVIYAVKNGIVDVYKK
jgi:DNA-binding NarL/FixJ family response regulator